MVKAYLRYVADGQFGCIASNDGNLQFDDSGKLAICPANEHVLIWHLKQGILVGKWQVEAAARSPQPRVTCIQKRPGQKQPTNGALHADHRGYSDGENQDFAVGYSDGSVRLWRLGSDRCLMQLNGHQSAITCLHFNGDGTLLASGSRDTDCILWDVVGERGLVRLRGHKDQITGLHFLYPSGDAAHDTHEEANPQRHHQPSHLVSASKDTLCKIWELTTQHCIETVVGHRSEIWSTALSPCGRFLVTGTADMELKVWQVHYDVLASRSVDDEMDGEQESNRSIFTSMGSVARTGKERVVQLSFHRTGRYFACQSSGKSMELYKVRTDSEVKRKLAKKKQSDEKQLEAGSRFISFRVFRTSAKMRSFDFAPENPKQTDSLALLIGLTNNNVELHHLHLPTAEVTVVTSLDIPGHHADIRTVQLSSDDEMILTGGSDGLKIWNSRTLQCIRSITTGGAYTVCSVFVPGNRFIIAGTKNGELMVFDGWSAAHLETIKAHDGTIWSIDVRPDKKGILTGSSDKDVKIWDFGAIEDQEYSQTVKLTDEVLFAKYSPNGQLIAVAMLDATIKVFYADSLKFFLNLYGHKLPILSIDISSDNKLLVSASADKNVKIWGLDFGDCHKSLHAHDDSVLQVKFVPQTHYFFSCSKDKTIKYWDADRFQQISKLEGHHGEVWCLAVARWGAFVVSASHDKSVRIWRKSDEQMFLSEEREMEMEKEIEREYETMQARHADGENVGETGAASKKTSESLKAGERILEAITLVEEKCEQLEEYEKTKNLTNTELAEPQPNPILIAHGNISAENYVFQVCKNVRSADLESALLVLPFSKILTLFSVMTHWAKSGQNIVLACRMTTFLLGVFHDQLTSNRHTAGIGGQSQTLREILDCLRDLLRTAIRSERDRLGYNLAGMRFVQSKWEEDHVVEFVDWEKEMGVKASEARNSKRKRKTNSKTVLKTVVTSNAS